MERRNFIKALGLLPLGMLSQRFLIGEYYSSVLPSVPKKSGMNLTEFKVSEFQSFGTLFVPGQLTVIAGRPSLGKTAFALQATAFAALKQNLGVAYFSLEQSKESLIERLMCQEAGISTAEYRSGRINQTQWGKIAVVAKKVSNSRLYIDDSANKTPAKIASKIIRLSSPMNVVFIDYLQLMNHDGDFKCRRDHVNQIVCDLKALAKKHNISVIVAAQLNRPTDSRKQPDLSNLRELTDYTSIDKTVFIYQSDGAKVLKVV